ncbi:FAD-dependent pyridine nucleotide-disulfide oxidoreductase [Stagonosporopsis vannaccii]|nr:FAD-dependent pyridine nucleotide-disulfide oxidoreductase [Stagonosporopsis vannaccii]
MTSTPKPKVLTYTLPPTKLIPNSPHVLIHYPGLLTSLVQNKSFSTTQIFDLFASNGWQSQWIARYGPNQNSHYHSGAHECMAVISGGRAQILFGVADSAEDRAQDLGLGTAGRDINEAGREDGGVLLDAEVGDVFILPAGVAHKTHNPSPPTDGIVFHQPPDKRDEKGCREFFAGIPIEGEFMMMGAYPRGEEWDFRIGGEHEGRFGEVWGVEVPERDPVLGTSGEGLVGLWRTEDKSRL